MPPGASAEKAVFRCNLFYPNGESEAEADFEAVYVNVPCCTRVNGVLKKGLCEVYKVDLADLVPREQVTAEQRPVSEMLWMGV
eukprot:2918612-Rhodomonas_salina.1